MATYLYHCAADGNEVEVRHGMNESPEIVCEVCEGVMHKKLTAEYTGIIDKHFEGNNYDRFA